MRAREGSPPQKKGSTPQSSPKPEIEEDEDVASWGKDYHRRIVFAFWILIIVGVLGIASSIATVTSSFIIRDLEEQSPNTTVTFSVWVFDSETGRSIENAEVSLRSDGYNVSSYSNNEGLTVLRNVRTGNLNLEIRHEDYKTSTGSVWISKGSPNVLDVPLEKGPPSEIVELPLTPLESKRYSPGLTNLAAIVMFLSSIMAFVAAFFVKARDFFTLAVIASFFTIFSFGFLIGSVLALVALILVINSNEGFFHNYELRMVLEEEGREDIKRFFMGERKVPPGLPPAK